MVFFKRLELHGFKSFANKTTIDLHPGITVIVGPNGCGKSNVFDSIRWVLGEMSAKSLRGERMEDVIFSGSGSLKPLGMSRVNLVMDNSTRMLPIDFDEVSIGRRLFRTGESEYLLNKTTCRRKDITTLFLDTGIGTDGYSVMEQGKVDQVINSKPLERRAIFDEAAGIAKYKVRKDEALRKLDRTDADLLRVADIINEVRRQANSLKRQASKASRWKRLSAELAILEMEQLARRHFEFMIALTEASAVAAHFNETTTALRTELASLDEEQNTNRSRAEEVQASLESRQSLQFQLNSAMSDATGKIMLFEQRVAGYHERTTELAAEIERLVAEETATGEEIARQETAIAAQSAALESIQHDFEQKKARHDELRNSADTAVAEIARLRGLQTDAHSRRIEADNESRLASAMERKLEDERERGETEMALLLQQVERLAADRDERHGSAEEAEQVLAALKSDFADTAQALRECEEKLAASTGELEAVRKETNDSQTRHDTLAELQENFEGYYQGVREAMLAAKNGRLHGLLGTISTLIEAGNAHELAIDVALGAKAQDIIAETADNARDAIHYLKENRKGQATFLPLDLVDARNTSDELRAVCGEPGVIGIARDLVQFDPRMEAAVQYLLGGVLVCENLDKAIELKRRGLRARFVTLGGEMVNASGAMTGGSVRSSGLLHRTREIKELAARLKTLRARLTETDTLVTSLRAERTELRERHEKLQRSVNTQEIDAARARTDFEVVDSKLSEKDAARAALEAKRHEIAAEIGQQVQRRETALCQVAEAADEAARLGGQVDAAESAARNSQREAAEFAAEVNELLVVISTNRERLSGIRDRLAQSQRDRVRIATLVSSRQTEIDSLNAQEQQAHAEITTLRATLADLERQADEIRQQITIETSARETIQLDLKRLGERASVLQRDLNESQNQMHEAEVRLAQVQVQHQSVQATVMEKFNMEPAALAATVLFRPAAAPAETDTAPATDGADTSEDEVVEPSAESAAPAFDLNQALADLHALAPADALSMLRDGEELNRQVHDMRARLETIGPVNVAAIEEYTQLRERHDFLTQQETDLQDAKRQLTETIAEIDLTTTDLFTTAFAEIRDNFRDVFRRLFGGGRADLVLTDEAGVLNCGIDIIAQPPGKKTSHISLLSGGEKALTAISLLFAIFQRKPSPFCILDEIDAPLDDKNIERFKSLVREFASTTQFIIITHNKQSMALANTVYGVTMEEQGVSRIVSIRLDEFDQSEFAREAMLAG